MKVLGVLLLMIAITSGGERPCAHALSAGQDSGLSHQMPSDSMNHESMGHDMVHTVHQGEVHHTNHCPDDCEGGSDCSGCTACSQLNVTDRTVHVRDHVGDTHELIASAIAQTRWFLDPPPPKALSLI